MLNLRTHVLIPRVPDLVRPGALKLYADRGFTLVGICHAPTRALSACSDGFFHAIRLSVAATSPADPDYRTVRRLIASSADIFVLLDLSGLARTGPLEQVTEELASALFWGPTALRSPLSLNHPLHRLPLRLPALPRARIGRSSPPRSFAPG